MVRIYAFLVKYQSDGVLRTEHTVLNLIQRIENNNNFEKRAFFWQKISAIQERHKSDSYVVFFTTTMISSKSHRCQLFRGWELVVP